MPDATSPLYHLALPDEWETACRQGRYERSTRGRSLAEEGFVHCSYASQVTATANRFYGDVDELIVLSIDTERLHSPVVAEPAVVGGELFPHVYGSIPVDAVIAATRWSRAPDAPFGEMPGSSR